MYDEALAEAHKIVDPVVKMTRINDLNSLKIHFDFAGYNLGLRKERPTFAEACENTTGHRFVPSEESLDEMAGALESKLAENGFKEGNLEKRMDDLRKSLKYIKKEDVVGIYRELMEGIVARAAEILGIDPDYFKLDVRALPEERGNLASFEYQGDGVIRTSIKAKDKTFTKPSLILLSVHEATHLLSSVLRELYYKATGDKYAAVGTMSTASVALDEGLGEHGPKIYKDVVDNLIGDDEWAVDIMLQAIELGQGSKRYLGEYAHAKLADPGCDRDALREDIRSKMLKYGATEVAANDSSRNYINDQNRHKALMYWPHYGEATRVVTRVFSQFESIGEAFKRFSEFSKEKGPLTLQSFEYAFSGN